MNNTKVILACLALFLIGIANAQAKLYKWVDDEGVTHYGETIPPEYANREAQQIEKGIVKPKAVVEKPGAIKKEVPEDQATIDQRRRDEALLGSYTNEQEIDLARDRNLQQIDARTNSIKTRLDNAQGDLNEHRREQEVYTKTGKTVPPSLIDDIARDEAKVGKLQGELNQSQSEAATLKARYEADKQRFRELKKGTTPQGK
jgi:chromosome segregation ATPase